MTASTAGDPGVQPAPADGSSLAEELGIRAAAPAEPAAGERGARSRWWRLSGPGLAGAVVGLWAALTPSLLPRPTLFLGVIAGAGAALGYGLGVFVAWVLRRVGGRTSPRVRRIGWRVFAVAGAVLTIAALVVGTRWQDDVRLLVGEAPDTSAEWSTAVIALVTAVVLLAVARALRGIGRLLAKPLGRVVPAPVATLIVTVLLAVGLIWVISGTAEHALQTIADGAYTKKNDTTDPDTQQPATRLRSGSPQSLVAWDTLGRTGRNFVAGGPTRPQLREVTGVARPKLPIRVYVGVRTSESASERARLAVAELQRTGAFERKLLVVAGATGTGWLEPQSVDAMEYLWGGDTAIVTSQYSYLPSWMSVLLDRERAADAGRELFDAVYETWSQLPPQSRPKLMTYGLSLGSFSIQSAFGSAGDMAARTDAGVYVGSPSFSQPWADITRHRDAGSPQWQPVFRDGAHVRFGARPEDFARPQADWSQPRAAYLQHGDDPVVWWTSDLLWREPDWLAEPHAPTVSPAMRWLPVVTFLQVTVDQFFGTAVPNGYGHNYAINMVGTLSRVLPPPDLTPAVEARVHDVIAAYPID